MAQTLSRTVCFAIVAVILAAASAGHCLKCFSENATVGLSVEFCSQRYSPTTMDTELCYIMTTGGERSRGCQLISELGVKFPANALSAADGGLQCLRSDLREVCICTYDLCNFYYNGTSAEATANLTYDPSNSNPPLEGAATFVTVILMSLCMAVE